MAICRPKLSDTFFVPNAVASTASSSDDWSRADSGCVSDSVRIWKFVYPPFCSAPRPWMDALPWPIRSASARTSSSAHRLRSLERDLRAALEVDAEIEPLNAIAKIEIAITTPEIANQIRRRPM